jgi:hypothetical protein
MVLFLAASALCGQSLSFFPSDLFLVTQAYTSGSVCLVGFFAPPHLPPAAVPHSAPASIRWQDASCFPSCRRDPLVAFRLASRIVVACYPSSPCTRRLCAHLLPGIGRLWQQDLPGMSVACLGTAPFRLSCLFRVLVPLARISVRGLCRWPLRALLFVDCAVCGRCFSLFGLLGLAVFCVGLCCWVGSHACAWLSVSCLLSCHFLPSPPRLFVTHTSGSYCSTRLPDVA